MLEGVHNYIETELSVKIEVWTFVWGPGVLWC